MHIMRNSFSTLGILVFGAGAEVLLTGAKTLCAAALLVSCTLLLIGSTTNPFLYLRF